MGKANFPVNCVERNFSGRTFYLDTRKSTEVKEIKCNALSVVHRLCTLCGSSNKTVKEFIMKVAPQTSIVINVVRHSARVEC